MEKLNDLRSKTSEELINPWNFKFTKNQPGAMSTLDERGFLCVEAGPRAEAFIKPDATWVIQFRASYLPARTVVIESKDTITAEYAFTRANNYDKDFINKYLYPGFLHYYLRCWRRRMDWLSSDEENAFELVIPRSHTKVAEFSSASNPGAKHYVVVDPNNKLYCTCMGFSTHHTCKHVDEILRAHNEYTIQN